MFLQSAFQFGQYRKMMKKKRKNKVGTFKTIFVTRLVPNRTGLNLSFARVLRYVFLVKFYFYFSYDAKGIVAAL